MEKKNNYYNYYNYKKNTFPPTLPSSFFFLSFGNDASPLH